MYQMGVSFYEDPLCGLRQAERVPFHRLPLCSSVRRMSTPGVRSKMSVKPWRWFLGSAF